MKYIDLTKPETFPTYMCKIMNGNLWCGSRFPDKLYAVGDGKTTTQNTLVEILSGQVTKFVFGRHQRCALKNQDVYCWGNYSGYLITIPIIGDGTATSWAPKKILSGATDIVATDNMTCATVGGALKCWGDLPLGTYLSQISGTPRTLIESGVIKIAAGNSSTCAATNEFVRCFGTIVNSGSGVDMKFEDNQSFSGITQLSVGLNRICIVKNEKLYCTLNRPSGFGMSVTHASNYNGSYTFRYPTQYPNFVFKPVSCYQSGVKEIAVGKSVVYVLHQSGVNGSTQLANKVSRFFNNSCEPIYLDGTNYSASNENLTELYPFENVIKIRLQENVRMLCIYKSNSARCLSTEVGDNSQYEIPLTGEEQMIEYW